MKLPEEISVSVKDVPEVIKQFEIANKEIERLNKEIIGLNNCIIEFHSEFCNKQAEINRLNNIIKEVREEIKTYEEQSNDGTTNELDNYVFIQRLKKVLDKGE